MYQVAREAEEALAAARSKVLKALNDASRDGRATEVARCLTGLNYVLMGAQFIVADAVHEAQSFDAATSHEGATYVLQPLKTPDGS